MADHIGAPTNPDEIPKPLPVNAPGDNDEGVEEPSEFKTGPVVSGKQPKITRGLAIGLGVGAVIFFLTMLQAFGAINIDFLSPFSSHNASASPNASPSPTPVAMASTTANDGALGDILNGKDPTPSPPANGVASPGASASPVSHPPGWSPYQTTPPPAPAFTPSATSPYQPQTVASVPNVDTSGPDVQYQPVAPNYSQHGRIRMPNYQVSNDQSGLPMDPNNPAARANAAKTSGMVPTLPSSSIAGQSGPLGAGPSSPFSYGSPVVPGAGGLSGSFNQQSATRFDKTSAEGYLPQTRQAAISHYEIWTGRKFRLLLDDAVMVDLPGQVCAHLIEPEKDSQTGTVVLIPERTQVCGVYNSIIGNGASKVQFAFQSATFPDGSTLALEGMGSSDRNGWSGNSADVNNHIGAIIGTTLLTSAMAAALAIADPASNVSSGYGGAQVQSPGQAAGQNILNTGSQITSQKVNQPPTLSLKKSTEIELVVGRTIVLPPYFAVPAMDQRD